MSEVSAGRSGPRTAILAWPAGAALPATLLDEARFSSHRIDVAMRREAIGAGAGVRAGPAA